MAILYEIDQEIFECVDQETGEILDVEKLNELQMERDKKIEKVALWYKNLVSDATAYKAEKEAFAEREKAAKNKAESLKNWLGLALNGSKLTTEKVAITFRKSEAVEIEDEEAFVKWAYDFNDELLSFKDPTPNKTAIKNELKLGVEITGAHLVERQNIQIK